MKQILLYLSLALSAFALPPVETLPTRAAFEAYNAWTGGYRGSVGYTHSMEPYVHGGEIILGEPYHGQPIQVGDLIVFQRWDKPQVIHRVIQVSATRFHTQGLNCHWPDEWYPYKRVLYVVRRVIRISR